jgi:hypothetical protein
LGERYGTVPIGQERSITEEEIRHAVLHAYVPKQIIDLKQSMNLGFEGRPLSGDEVECLVSCYEWAPDRHK